MKKLIVFVFILLCFCILTLNKQSKNPLLSKQNVESVCLVTDYEIVDSESVYCGNLVFNYCDITQANGKINQLKNNIKGIEFYLKDVSFDEICKDLKIEIVSQQNLNDIYVYSCYTPFGDKNIELNGKKINLQIAVYDDMIIAGFPMIVTGF